MREVSSKVYKFSVGHGIQIVIYWSGCHWSLLTVKNSFFNFCLVKREVESIIYYFFTKQQFKRSIYFPSLLKGLIKRLKWI